MPGASSAAAISLRALFFAPPTRTEPCRGERSVTAGDDEGLHQVGSSPDAAVVEARPASHSSVSRGLRSRSTGGMAGSASHAAIRARLLAKERKCQATIDSREKV